VVLRSAELFERIRAANEATGQLDWSLVRPDFEIYDHELVDSRVHRGHEGWKRWVADWQQAFEDYTLEPLERVEVDESRLLSVHRLRARGRASGVELERTDAQLWTFSGDRLVRMDYYPDYRGTSALGLSPVGRSDPGTLADLDETVRRHLSHALRPGAQVGAGTRLTIRGRIKVGTWLPFHRRFPGAQVAASSAARPAPTRCRGDLARRERRSDRRELGRAAGAARGAPADRSRRGAQDG
jgi:ketosteroid isomerase-like protein